MKTIFTRALIPIAALLLEEVDSEAATFSNLHNFTATSPSPPYGNSDGAIPRAGLVLSGNMLYGTAVAGGISNNGTVFRINTDGTSFTNLLSFTGANGRVPSAGLLISGSILYGTTAAGGTNGYGTVFEINTNGTGYTNLLNFTYATSQNGLYGGLVLSNNALYGTTDGGGSGFAGTVFKVNTDGTGYTNLHSFASYSGYPSATNSDGVFPDDTLVLSGNFLYGTTSSGGSNANGTVFRINTDGTGFTNLYIFSATTPSPPTFALTNTDGRSPRAGLVLSNNTLYGTARFGGSSANGTVFKLNTDGTGFTVLHSFSKGSIDPAISTSTNSDGSAPWGGLLLSGSTLYGTAATGGSRGSGSVFQLNTDGTAFTVLYSFSPVSSGSLSTNSDGANPCGALTRSGNTLFGTTESAGTGGSGTLFAVSLGSTPTPILLSVGLAAGKAVLSWSDPAAAFSLQVAPSVTGVYANVPGAVSPYTNLVTGSQSFFRLKGM